MKLIHCPGIREQGSEKKLNALQETPRCKTPCKKEVILRQLFYSKRRKKILSVHLQLLKIITQTQVRGMGIKMRKHTIFKIIPKLHTVWGL